MQWRKIKPQWLGLLLGILSIASCERVVVERDLSRLGYDYYPMSKGFFRTFDVYQINYNFATSNDTLEFEVMELIADHYLNQEGDTTFVLHRLSRREAENRWDLDSMYHIRKNELQAVELNNNVPLVKLVFPVAEGKTWDSNILNASLADSFRMVDVNKPFLLNDNLYSNTLTVLIRNIQDEIVRKDIRKEVYAKGIGPVYKIVQRINFCAEANCIGQGIVTSGILQEMKLKAYGKE